MIKVSCMLTIDSSIELLLASRPIIRIFLLFAHYCNEHASAQRILSPVGHLHIYRLVHPT